MSTAIFVPSSVYIVLCSFVIPKRSSDSCIRCPRGQEKRLSSGRNDLSACRPAHAPPPRRVPPCPGPPRPPVVCPGFGFDRNRIAIVGRIQNPDISRTGWDGAAHGGAAGRGGNGQDGTPTGWFAQKTTNILTLQTIEENLPGCVSGSKNIIISTSTDGGTKLGDDRFFIAGLSAVYHQDDGRSSFLVADQ